MRKHLSDEVISRIIFSCLLPIYRTYEWQENESMTWSLIKGKRKLQFCMDGWEAYLKRKTDKTAE